MEKYFDKVIAISVDTNLRRKRLKERNIDAYNDMLKLEKYQLSDQEKRKYADYVLYNDENEEKNINQIKEIIKKIIN